MMTKANRYFLFPAMLLLLIVSCRYANRPDLEVEKKKLLILHKEQQEAHLGENAKQFVDQFADSMFSVNRGKITITTKVTALKRFNDYFSNVEFKKWEDLNPPVIEFSADASMAYMLVDKQVILAYTNKKNILIEESTHYGWVSIF
jgi:hypothetical protein